MTETHAQIVILAVAGVAATLFLVGYGFLAPWWRSQFGLARIIDSASLAALVDLSLAAFWFGWTVPTHVATAIFVLIALGQCLLLATFVREQILKRH